MTTAISNPAQGGTRYAITVAFALLPEAREPFLALVRANAAVSLRDESECLQFDVLSPLAEGAADVVLYEIYENRAAFEAHLRSPHFRAFDEATRDMVTRKTVAEFSLLSALSD